MTRATIIEHLGKLYTPEEWAAQLREMQIVQEMLSKQPEIGATIVVKLPPPLAGHAGHCDKVTTATITGRTDAACSCGMASR